MSSFFSTIGLLLLFLLVSCSTTSTFPHSVGEKNVWFIESEGDEQFPIYCMANEKEKTAEPACFKAKKVGF